MRIFLLIGLLSLAIAVSWPSHAQQPEKMVGEISIQIKALGSIPPFRFRNVHYKAGPYVRAAASLQKAGKDAACKLLEGLGSEDRNDVGEGKWDDSIQGKIIVLCRMLFAAKTKATFREPSLGQPIFFGGTIDKDWSLVPIDLIDGVPFLIVRSYFLGGEPEYAHSYLSYCVKNCTWSNTRFDLVTDNTQQEALTKLLDSSKWKRPLTEDEREFFKSQIK